MPRHRESSLPDRPKRSLGIRIAATLTLVLGVAAGLYLGDKQGAKDNEAKHAEAVKAAEQAELNIIRADYVGWSRKMAVERAEDERIAQEEAAAKAAEEARKKAEEEAASRNKTRTAGTTNPTTYPIPASCNEYSGNRATGCALMLEAGYGLDQMPCLERLWTKESGWNEKSSNSSGAYGIPQALPGSKMATYGDDWQTNPVTQIKWGLSYIRSKYSTPCGAWSTFQSKGWY